MKEILQLKPSLRFRRALNSRSSVQCIQCEDPAVVFAPHQDDETLGCGGTILMKRQAGTSVKLVFMTDGTTSHSRFVTEAELSRMRNSEALEAARVLGLDERDVQFLGYPDSKLGMHHESAVGKAIEILRLHRPRDVFVPYRHDGTADHEATYRVVVDAVLRSGLRVRICEYPVWFWNQWPWVSFRFAPNRDTFKNLGRMARYLFGLRALQEFRCGVPIREHIEAKRKALAKHRSQMTTVISGVRWPVLADVSGGDFLECFFQEYEVFRCSGCPPEKRVDIRE